MDRKDLKNHRVDKVPLNRSKQLMWQHIQNKARVKQNWFQRLIHFLGLHKMAFTAALASVLIVVVVTTALNIPVIAPEVANASFQMEALDQDALGITPESGFKLVASEPVSETYVKENLQTNPPIDFEIRQLDETEFEVVPQQALEANNIYQFSISGQEAGQDKDFAWSYQVKDDFKILNTLPADKSTYVPEDTGIEIQFSHENFDLKTVQDYIEIKPALEGRFEKHQRTLAFAPENLEKGTLYTVIVKAGLPLESSEKTLKEDYQFQFQVESERQRDLDIRFTKQHYESPEGRVIGFSVYDYGQQNDEEEAMAKTQVGVYKFDDAEDFLGQIQVGSEQPQWARSFNSVLVDDLAELEMLGEHEVIKSERGARTFIYMPELALPKGYYLLEMTNGEKRSQTLLQVTNLSTYTNVTKTQTLVWVNDIETGLPIKEAQVSFVNSGVSAKTDEDGIAVFESPEVFLGQGGGADILKIEHEGDQLINLVNEADYFFRPGTTGLDYWYHLSTDRPVYQNKDTVKYWGFLQPRGEGGSSDSLRIVLQRENDQIEEQVLDISEDHFFSGEFELKGLSGSSHQIALYEGDELLVNQYIITENYKKPAYNIEIAADKKVAFAGDEVELDIATRFFDGTPVPKLDLNLYLDGETEQVQTDFQGMYHQKVTLAEDEKLSKPCSKNGYCDNRSWFNFSAEPLQGEETDIRASGGVDVFNSKIMLRAKTESAEENVAKVDVEGYFVDLEKEIDNYQGEFAPELEVTAHVTERSWDKEVTGEYYDYINKKVVETYRYKMVEVERDPISFRTDKSGEGSFEFEMDPELDYVIYLSAQDEAGNYSYARAFVSNSFGGYEEQDVYTIDLPYSYAENVFDIGESISAHFSKASSPIKEGAPGRFIYLKMQNGLRDYQVQESPTYEFKFETQDVPNVYISGVWFDGSNYHIANGSMANFKKESRRLNIEVEADELAYQPGDEVDLSVKVTDQKGNPVQAEVNLNLVDEAYYKVVYDQFSDPLEDIYQPLVFGGISRLVTHENPFNMFQGFDGGGCFVSGTQILMSDGSHKAIEDIQVGDRILTKEGPVSARLMPASVKSTIHHRVGSYLLINDDLKVTPEHIVFANGTFVTAGSLRVGDSLLNKDQAWVEIDSIQEVKMPVDVYNFEVEEYHTYFANGFYVHNDKGEVRIRSDFEDNAYFGSIQTNVNGVGQATIKLPDNITSWRVTAKAIDPEGLQAGFEVAEIPVSLPLFGDMVFNQEYSINDEPVVKMRAFGDGLKEGDPLSFELTSESLDFNSGALEVQAFQSGYVELPGLTLGEHDLHFTVSSDDYADAIQEPFKVVDSRLKKTHVEFVSNLTSVDQLIQKTDQPIQLTLLDGGRGMYYYDLISLYFTPGDRVDQRLSQWAAYELLQKYFDQNLPKPQEFVLSNYQVAKGGWPASQFSGVRLLPYAGPNLELSVLTLMADVDPNRFETTSLKSYFYEVFSDSDSNLNEVVLSLSGLAALNEPVLNSLHLLKDENKLSIKDHLYIASSMASLGDFATAEEIYKRAISLYSPSQEHVDVKALTAMVGAQLRQQNTLELWEKVETTKKEDDFLNLYQIGFLKYAMSDANPSPVSFKWNRNGNVQSLDFENGELYNTVLMPGDEVKLQVQSGQLSAIAHYNEPVNPESIQSPDEDFTIERRYQIDNKNIDSMKEGQLVEVELIVFRPPNKTNMPMKVTDILPSGLVPMTNSNFATGGWSASFDYPFQVEGQSVSFIWYENDISKKFSYMARVVAPGLYYADPAKMESFDDPLWQVVSESRWIEIEPINSLASEVASD